MANENDDLGLKLREQLRQGPRRCSVETRRAVALYARQCRAEGEQVRAVAKRLGMNYWTLLRWLSVPTGKVEGSPSPRSAVGKKGRPKAKRAFVEVRVEAPAPCPTTLVLVSPTGWRLEGVEPAWLARMLGGHP